MYATKFCPWRYATWKIVAGTDVAWTNVARTNVAWTNVAWTIVAWTNVAWTDVAWTDVVGIDIAWTNGTGPLMISQGWIHKLEMATTVLTLGGFVGKSCN